MNIVKISDGLGNQMFQYAFARKISILTGCKVYLDTRFINNEDLYKQGKNTQLKGKLAHREYGLQHFRIALPTADNKMLSHWKYLQDPREMQRIVHELAKQGRWIWQYQNENENFSGIPSADRLRFATYYQGYFFDLKYYDDIRTILQHEFTLREKLKLPKDLHKILGAENTVSVHIRRGDFLKLNRDISGSEYYERAFEYVGERIASPFYLIFSDDTEWVKDNMEIPGEKLFVSEMGFTDYEELAIMKHCKNNIIANSTFSYWAAYLNANPEKIVVCPKRWRTKTIPEKWISI